MKIKTRMDLLKGIEELPKFVKVLRARNANAKRCGYERTDATRWAASLHQCWHRAQNPILRQRNSDKVLRAYHAKK